VHLSVRRAAGYAAIAAPLLMWAEFLVMGLTRPGYNLLTRPFSDLATRGTSNAALFDLGFFIVPGMLTVVAGIGLWLTGGRTHAWRFGSVLTVAAGVFLFATGVFPQDPSSFSASIVHGTVSQICFAIASVTPLVLFVGSSREAHLDPPRTLWLMSGLAALAIEGVGVALRPLMHYPDGLFQRPFTVALTVWFVATGAWLLRVRKAEGKAGAE
jgi:hypothetical membrane protein